MTFKPWQTLWIKTALLTLLTLATIFMINQVFPSLFGRFFGAFYAIFIPFAIALFIVYLVAPLNQFLIKLNLQNKTARSLVIVLFLLVVIGIFAVTAGDVIYVQAYLFIENDWPEILAALQGLIDDNSGLSDIYDFVVPYLDFESISNVTVDIYGAFQSITNILIATVLTPVFLFFLLRDGSKIRHAIIKVLPDKMEPDAEHLTTRADTVIKQYFNGRFTSIAIMIVVFNIIFFIMGFGGRSLLFGFLLGVLDIIPYIGPVIGTLLPMLYTLTDKTIAFGDLAPLAVLIIVFVVNFLQNNLLQPYIMGRETKMHPLLVLSSLLFFGYLFGVVGIILAIPLTGTIRSSVEYYHEKNRQKAAQSKPKEAVKQK